VRGDPGCARAWSGLVNRRADNMLQLARDLRRTGQLRADLDAQQIADIIWATNSAEYFLLLVHRGRTAEQFGTHLVHLWTRTLLDPSAAQASTLDAERRQAFGTLRSWRAACAHCGQPGGASKRRTLRWTAFGYSRSRTTSATFIPRIVRSTGSWQRAATDITARVARASVSGFTVRFKENWSEE
jgi:hypothetical protein